jgi:hypothetical protein
VQRPVLTAVKVRGTFPVTFPKGAIVRRQLAGEPTPSVEAATRLVQVPRALLRPPPFKDRLVGRDSLLRQIKERLFGDGSTGDWTVLYGFTGVGKQTLALSLVWDAEVGEHFKDGILWASLGRAKDTLPVLNRWAAELRLQDNQMARLSEEERRERIHRAIAERQMLLVVDDVWYGDKVNCFRIGGPRCARLLTTPIPRVAWELTTVEGPIEVPGLAEDDGIQMLRERAPDVVDAYLGDIRELVRAVGGLPLALKLMGIHLRRAALGGQADRVRLAIDKLRSMQGRVEAAAERAAAVDCIPVEAQHLLGRSCDGGIGSHFAGSSL